jgi:hypothetical protein
LGLWCFWLADSGSLGLGFQAVKASPEHWYSVPQLVQTGKILLFYLLFWLAVGAVVLTGTYFIDGSLDAKTSYDDPY